MALRRLTLIAAAFAAAALTPIPSMAAGVGGAFSFGAVPVSAKGGVQRSYFTFAVEAGGTSQDRIIVSNASAKPVTLRLSVSAGTTAEGSGGAFITDLPHCRGAACWIHGLPSRIILRAHRQRVIPFTVRIPAGARNRQYLAGITVQPAALPAPTTIRSRNGVGAKAIVIHQVNVGVALTVGPLSSMTSKLEIVRVVPVGIGGSARLLVSERNVGDTFLKATGQAICLAGKVRHAYPLSSDTVLPGNTTTLAVNTPGLPSGADIHCRVVLNYVGADGATAPASWRGIVKIPKLVKPHVVQTGPGSYAAVPKAHVPRWAIALIAAGGAIVLALVVVIVLLLRRRPPATA